MKKAQALIQLIVITFLAMMVIGTAVAVNITLSQNSTNATQSQFAHKYAESGIENATLKLLRDPTYIGETLIFTDGTCVITVTGTFPNKTISVIGISGGIRRKVQASANMAGNKTLISNWVDVEE